MTKINLLEKRKKSIEQRMNRLRLQDAALNVQLRKKRTRRLIELGGLVSKAELEDWNANTLFGALQCGLKNGLMNRYIYRLG